MRIIKNIDLDNFIKSNLFILRNNYPRIKTSYKYYLNDKIIGYINKCFDDSLSFKESLYRIYYDIDIHPKCKYCNNLVRFHLVENNLFNEICENKECSKKLNSEHGIQTKLNKYGYYFVNSDKIKETKLKKYGNENYNNQEKTKKTCLKKIWIRIYII